MAQDSSTSSDTTRIQIERVEEWNRIRENFTEAMFNTLSEKLAQSSSQHVRDAVSAHLIEWRDRTFDATKENLRVNGHNFEDYNEEQDGTEPFDEVLDRRIWSLSTERMTWDKELADRRRIAPSEVRNLVEDLLMRQRAAEFVPPSMGDDIDLDVDEERLSREVEVEKIFKQIIVAYNDLQTTVPQVLERTERAQAVAEEIQNLTV